MWTAHKPLRPQTNPQQHTPPNSSKRAFTPHLSYTYVLPSHPIHPSNFTHNPLHYQMSSQLIRALTLAHAILEIHRTSRPRLFFLRPSWLWLGMTPRALAAEEEGPSPPAPDVPIPDADVLSLEEARQVENAVLPGSGRTYRHRMSLRRAWNGPLALRARIRVSNGLWRVRHSKHVHHAIKNALGIGLLLIPAVLPASSPGKSLTFILAIVLTHPQVKLISILIMVYGRLFLSCTFLNQTLRSLGESGCGDWCVYQTLLLFRVGANWFCLWVVWNGYWGVVCVSRKSGQMN
jgi:hypothetical protein